MGKEYQNLKEVYPALKRIVNIGRVAAIMGMSPQGLNFKFNRTQFFTRSEQKAFSKTLDTIANELSAMSSAVAKLPVRSED